MSFHKKISDLLSGASQGALWKTFTNGGLDADISVVDALVVNDAATIKTTAQLLKQIRDAQTTQTAALQYGLVLYSNENHIGQIGGRTYHTMIEVVRPADVLDYAANDIISNAVAGGVAAVLPNAFRVNGGSGYITGVKFITDKVGVTARIRLHFGRTQATTSSQLNDNVAAANLYTTKGLAGYLGYIDLAPLAGASGSSFVCDNTQRMAITADGASTDLYCVIETLDAIVAPASGQKYTIQLAIEQN